MIMSSRFWVYWVTTIPVTIAVIAVWRIWMHYQYRPFEESLGMMEAGNLSSEEKSSLHDDIESPFYPLVYRENF
jgi:hypothetical protein